MTRWRCRVLHMRGLFHGHVHGGSRRLCMPDVPCRIGCCRSDCSLYVRAMPCRQVLGKSRCVSYPACHHGVSSWPLEHLSQGCHTMWSAAGFTCVDIDNFCYAIWNTLISTNHLQGTCFLHSLSLAHTTPHLIVYLCISRMSCCLSLCMQCVVLFSHASYARCMCTHA